MFKVNVSNIGRAFFFRLPVYCLTSIRVCVGDNVISTSCNSKVASSACIKIRPWGLGTMREKPMFTYFLKEA